MEYEQLSQPTGKPLSLAELVAAVDSALFRDEDYDSDFLPAPDAPEATSLPSRKAYDLEDVCPSLPRCPSEMPADRLRHS